uniref:Ketoreductase domain-containing protein n=1 Tax=Alexandrium catenella TaxID=2925 RepID=A0A7S1QI40_ALECA|mmetsp:Transcript_31176/g.84573  ORF Transcript_31176/g.84573 Transcript_31176/m.84573 type:complete len:603 (+) Transcript_31176:104-1912(+)
MYDEESGLLTMVGEQTSRIGPAYEKLMAEKSAVMSGGMCWPLEWFPEHMPIENASGTATEFYFRSLANPLGTVSQFPEVDYGQPSKEDVLVFSDSYGFCKEIMEQAPPNRLGITNVQTKLASKYVQKDVKNLVKMHPWDMIIFALGIDPPDSNDVEVLHKHQFEVVMPLLYIMQEIANDSTRCKRLAIITADCFADEREFHEENGIGGICNCTLFGMANTGRQEIQCPVQYIDTEWALRTENTKYIVAELFRHQSFGYNTVRILNKGRYVLRQMPAKPYEHGPDFVCPDEGVVGISGGNGALGLVMGLWMLRKAQQQGGKKFSIQFLSRSAKINDQNMPNWKEVERLAAELGISVIQAKCDCSKQEGVEEYIREKTPNLAGFIHSAGILQDSMLYNQTWEKFDAVFEAKSRAALYLHDALERYENPGLEFFWMFSSVAVFGNMGQLNYSASNSFLDGLARHRRALGKVCQAPQWGAWGDVGMAANLDDASRRRMANSPMPYFSNAEGLYGLECGLRSNLAFFSVYKFNPPLMFGMIQGDDVPMQNYTRNITSEICPPPPGDPTKNLYSTIGYEMRTENHRYENGLVFQSYWPEVADAAQYAL